MAEEVENWKSQLEKAQTFIYDVDRMAETEEGEEIKTRVKQLSEACHRLEDMIDEYHFKEQQQQQQFEYAPSLCEDIETMLPRLQIWHQIHQIDSQVRAIKASGPSDDAAQRLFFLDFVKIMFPCFRVSPKFHRSESCSSYREDERRSIKESTGGDIIDFSFERPSSSAENEGRLKLHELLKSLDLECPEPEETSSLRENQSSLNFHGSVLNSCLKESAGGDVIVNIEGPSSSAENEDRLKLLLCEDQEKSLYLECPEPEETSSFRENPSSLNFHVPDLCIKESAGSDIIGSSIEGPSSSAENEGCLKPLLCAGQGKSLYLEGPEPEETSSFSENQSSLKFLESMNQVKRLHLEGPGSYRENETPLEFHVAAPAPLYMDEDESVNLEVEDPEEKLLDWLIDGSEECTVICVVGMGGVGKTTLASNVFKNMKVIQNFDCRAWITVSQSSTADGLLRDMLRKFYRQERKDPPWSISTMDRDLLIDEVREYLEQKRYVIFFDDVWDTYFWDEISFAVFDNEKRSRVVITTRDMDVAMSCCKSSPVEIYEMQPLSPKKSLELFYTRAFDQFELSPPHLVPILSPIVTKCEGNPLVIAVVAGLISARKTNEHELESLAKRLLSEFGMNSMLTGMTKIIGFSYDDLPNYLKRCFLYFGMYPDDYEVESRRLIRQWIAEGFVTEGNTDTYEHVAEEYLAMLINRSLVHVSSHNTDGKRKVCRVHNLLRYMILEKCKDLSFCHYISEDADQSVSTGKVLRLSVATSSIDDLMGTESSHVRSLFFFTDNELPEDFVTKILAKYRLLRVLDFENALLHCVPENLGKLFQLKYLSLRNTQVKNLPKSIGMLQNLETLDIRETHVHEMPLPKEISMLQKLRHLLGNNMSLIQLRGCIRNMTSLQTLNEVQIDYDVVELIKELAMLPQLGNLGLTNVRQHEQEGYEVEILHFEAEGFQNLEELELTSLHSLSCIFVDEGALPCLRKVELNNTPQLKTFPDVDFKAQYKTPQLKAGPDVEIKTQSYEGHDNKNQTPNLIHELRGPMTRSRLKKVEEELDEKEETEMITCSMLG